MRPVNTDEAHDLFDDAGQRARKAHRRSVGSRVGQPPPKVAVSSLLVVGAVAGVLGLGRWWGAVESEQRAGAELMALEGTHRAELARRDAAEQAGEKRLRPESEPSRAPAGLPGVTTRAVLPTSVAQAARALRMQLATIEPGHRAAAVDGETSRGTGGLTSATRFTGTRQLGPKEWGPEAALGARKAIVKSLASLEPGRVPAAEDCGDGSVVRFSGERSYQVLATTRSEERGRFFVTRGGRLVQAFVCSSAMIDDPGTGSVAEEEGCQAGFTLLERSDQDPIVQMRFQQVALCASAARTGGSTQGTRSPR